MSDAKDVVKLSIDALQDRTAPDAKMDCQKFFKYLTQCGAQKVQMDGQRYTHVSLEDLLTAIEDSIIDPIK